MTMENVLALQLIETVEKNADADLLGSLASAGCDKPE
jgi:hypothetical protein